MNTPSQVRSQFPLCDPAPPHLVPTERINWKQRNTWSETLAEDAEGEVKANRGADASGVGQNPFLQNALFRNFEFLFS